MEQLVNGSMILGVAAVPITSLLSWVIATLLLYLVFRLVNCEKGLKKYFSMTAFIMVITVVGMIIQSAYINITGNSITIPLVTSLASLIDPDLQGTFLFELSKQIEVFNLWAFVLFGLGFVYTGGVDRKKSLTVTILVAVLVIFASAGISLLSQGMQNQLLGGMKIY